MFADGRLHQGSGASGESAWEGELVTSGAGSSAGETRVADQRVRHWPSVKARRGQLRVVLVQVASDTSDPDLCQRGRRRLRRLCLRRVATATEGHGFARKGALISRLQFRTLMQRTAPLRGGFLVAVLTRGVDAEDGLTPRPRGTRELARASRRRLCCAWRQSLVICAVRERGSAVTAGKRQDQKNSPSAAHCSVVVDDRGVNQRTGLRRRNQGAC